MTIIVVDRKGNKFQNLVGVFGRVFPIAVSHVKRTGEPISVGYYGSDYTIMAETTDGEGYMHKGVFYPSKDWTITA